MTPMNREWCPGGGDWALDENLWHDTLDHHYFCRGCGRYLKVPRSGHRVGLVPVHKREVGEGYRPHPSEAS
jgi:hypothetical protein